MLALTRQFRKEGWAAYIHIFHTGFWSIECANIHLNAAKTWTCTSMFGLFFLIQHQWHHPVNYCRTQNKDCTVVVRLARLLKHGRQPHHHGYRYRAGYPLRSQPAMLIDLIVWMWICVIKSHISQKLQPKIETFLLKSSLFFFWNLKFNSNNMF